MTTLRRCRRLGVGAAAVAAATAMTFAPLAHATPSAPSTPSASQRVGLSGGDLERFENALKNPGADHFEGPLQPLRTSKHYPGGVPAGPDGPVQHDFPSALTYATLHPGTNPQGANDFSCKPRRGQRPVVLLSGTFNDAYTGWSHYSPVLKKLGYCVFAPSFNPLSGLDTGSWMGDVRTSAKALAGFVDRVRASTGSDKVDIIGQSLGGGLLPHTYIRQYGGGAKVNKLISLVPSNDGTNPLGLSKILGVKDAVRTLGTGFDAINARALAQQVHGNPFLERLRKNGLTDPRVQYVGFSTRLDDVLLPWDSTLYPTTKNTRSHVLQDLCPLDATDHFGIYYDPVAMQLVINELTGRNTPVNCRFVPPLLQ